MKEEDEEEKSTQKVPQKSVLESMQLYFILTFWSEFALLAGTFFLKFIPEMYFWYLFILFPVFFIVVPFVLMGRKPKEDLGMEYRPFHQKEVAEIERQLSKLPGVGKKNIVAMTHDKKYSNTSHAPKNYYFKFRQTHPTGLVEEGLCEMPAISPHKERTFNSFEPGIVRVENKLQDWGGDIKYPSRSSRDIYGVSPRKIRVKSHREVEEDEEPKEEEE